MTNIGYIVVDMERNIIVDIKRNDCYNTLMSSDLAGQF
jgi:hypothetical protein